MAEWLGPEAEEAIRRIEGSRPPVHAERIYQATLLEQQKGFCSGFLTRQDLDRRFRPGPVATAGALSCCTTRWEGARHRQRKALPAQPEHKHGGGQFIRLTWTSSQRSSSSLPVDYRSRAKRIGLCTTLGSTSVWEPPTPPIQCCGGLGTPAGMAVHNPMGFWLLGWRALWYLSTAFLSWGLQQHAGASTPSRRPTSMTSWPWR